MSPQELLLHVFCLVDDELQALHLGRLRTRGPRPKLADSEVITMELSGDALTAAVRATGVEILVVRSTKVPAAKPAVCKNVPPHRACGYVLFAAREKLSMAERRSFGKRWR